jgi:hypothetical protein
LQGPLHLKFLKAMAGFVPGFAYQRLDENLGEIRLLRLLHPSHVCVAECEIKHFRFGRAPPYTALSYCLGSPSRTNSILVNGGHLAITQNLSSYIEHATTRQSDEPPRYLWIDAICINQADVVERSKQVLKMRQILRTWSVFRGFGQNCMRRYCGQERCWTIYARLC